MKSKTVAGVDVSQEDKEAITTLLEARKELEARARRLEIRGRSKMGKDELRTAIKRAS
jgi:hypothetical protein